MGQRHHCISTRTAPIGLATRAPEAIQDSCVRSRCRSLVFFPLDKGDVKVDGRAGYSEEITP
jgi:hypothetical protein